MEEKELVPDALYVTDNFTVRFFSHEYIEHNMT